MCTVCNSTWHSWWLRLVDIHIIAPKGLTNYKAGTLGPYACIFQTLPDIGAWAATIGKYWSRLRSQITEKRALEFQSWAMELGSSSAPILVGRFEKLKKIKKKPLEVAKAIAFLSTLSGCLMPRLLVKSRFPGEILEIWNQDGQEKYQ